MTIQVYALMGSMSFAMLVNVSSVFAQAVESAIVVESRRGETLEHAHSVARAGTNLHDGRMQHTPTLARIAKPDAKDGMKSLSACCHILLFYGLGSTDLKYFTSGEMALKALTDEAAAISVFGKSPFVVTRNGLRYLLSNDPVFHSDVGETHRDQCLATFGTLGIPLTASIRVGGRAYTVADLLSETVANFSYEQRELAWTAIALAKYLPPKATWVNRFREKATFSQLARFLLQRDLNTESCWGTHILQAVVQVGNADRRFSVLDPSTREALNAYVAQRVRELAKYQRQDGSWSEGWCDSISVDGSERVTPFRIRFLITGHIVEVIEALQPSQRPAEEILTKAVGWLADGLQAPEIKPDGSWLCPYTHAAKAARKSQAEKAKKNFHLPSGRVDSGLQKPSQ